MQPADNEPSRFFEKESFFDYRGRLRRGPSVVRLVGLLIVAAHYGKIVDSQNNYLMEVTTPLSAITFAYLMAAQLVKRLHDMGKSGLHVLWLLIPFAGILFALWVLSRPSQPEANAWAPGPLDV
jgi:uncharacterized membrane protein YhaH (DUF805 family)